MQTGVYVSVLVCMLDFGRTKHFSVLFLRLPPWVLHCGEPQGASRRYTGWVVTTQRMAVGRLLGTTV